MKINGQMIFVNIVGSKKTHKSNSISQSKGTCLWNQMKSKTRHVDVWGSYPRVHEKIVKHTRFAKQSRFNEDIQIQIDKPN